MQTAHWRELRQLFDAVCDLPPERWKERLREISDDPALIDEALSLLEAQTASFNRALQPLGELMASLSETELQAGDRLGSWLLVERLASGGMGTVFVAERADELFRQRVAIKLLRSGVADPATAARLAAERQILAELQHPDIARLYDGGTTPRGQPYLVMEYVAGLPLDRHCTERKLGLRDRLQLFLRVCRAVQAAHQRLIVHCDLKPSNVLVRENGEPVLLDFGIARLLGEGESGDAGGFCTPAYASPELLGAARVGVASDVFSLGVLLTELLADRRADRGTADRERPVPLPSALAGADCTWKRRLRGDLDAIAGRACALDPARRYPSVEALVGDLGRHLVHRPVRARRPTLHYRLGRWLRRHWREAAIVGAAVLTTAGFLWRVTEERARAEQEAAIAGRVSDFLVETFTTVDAHTRSANAAEELSARDVLDRGAAKIDSGLADSPATLASLRFVLGRAYRNLGYTRVAEPLLARAAEEFLDPRVDRPDRAAEALSELSFLMSNHGRADEAVAVAQRMLGLRQQSDGDPVLLADSYNVLGLALRQKADFAGARAALEEALALRREWLGPTHAEVAVSLHNLGLLHRDMGDYAGAETFYRQALEIKRLQGERHTSFMAGVQSLAVTLAAQARFAEAAGLLRENLELARSLYDEDSDKLAQAKIHLGNALHELGDYAQARELFQQALASSARAAGDNNLNYSFLLDYLAAHEEARGDDASAEALYRRALAIRRDHLSADDRGLLRAENNLGCLLMRMGRLEEARPMLDDALAKWRRIYQGQHPPPPELAQAQLTQVEWLLRQGLLAQARAALPALAEDAPKVVARHLALNAELAQRRGEWSKAGAGWRRLIELSTAQAGADSVVTAKWRVPYVETLAAAGDAAAAREQLRLAEPPLRRELVPGAELLRRMEALKAGAVSKATDSTLRADSPPAR